MHSQGTAEYRKEAWYGAVQRCVLLRNLPQAELEFICQGTRVVPTTAGETLYKQGDIPNMLYLVHSGEYAATIAARSSSGSSWRARDYGPMDSFGACELLNPEMLARGRACTITVTTGGVLWGIPKRLVDLKLKAPPLHGIPGLRQFARELELFRILSDGQLDQLCRCAHKKDLSVGDHICKQGDPARSLFTVWKGTVMTYQRESTFSMTMKPPMMFGESALFYDEGMRNRQASVKATDGGAVALRWPVNEIETLIGYDLHKASEQLYTRKFMQSVQFESRSIMAGLKDGQINTLIDLLQVQTFEPGTTVLQPGVLDECIMIVKSGNAAAVIADHHRGPSASKSTKLTILEKADYFGEFSLLALDGQAKQPKRRCQIVVEGDVPLVIFVLNLSVLSEVDTLTSWLQFLSSAVSQRAPTSQGLDLLVERGATAAGIDLVALFEKKEKGKRGEKGGKSYARAKDATRGR